MLDLPGECLDVRPHRDEPELGVGVAGPRAGLALAVALQEEAQGALGGAVLAVAAARHHHYLPWQIADVAGG